MVGIRVVLLVHVALLLVSLCHATVQNGKVLTCPPPPKCGLYLNKMGKSMVCGKCAIVKPGEKVSRLCDYGSGQCVINPNAMGNPCTPKKTVCPSGTTCQKDKTATAGFRCCSSKCPPNLCGLANITFTTFCGTQLNCNKKC